MSKNLLQQALHHAAHGWTVSPCGVGFVPTQFSLSAKSFLAIAAFRITFILRGVGL